MKKLVVLAMLLVAGMLWAQAAAAPAYPQVTLGGAVVYMGVSDLGAGKTYSDKPDIEVKWTVKTDDFNSVYIELDGESTDNIGGTGDLTKAIEAPFDRAWFSTDLGKALKLPVGVVTTIGFNEWKNKDGNKVTKGEWEDIIGKGFKKWGVQFEVMPAPIVTLRSTFVLDADEKAIMVGAYGAQGPVSYEAAYYTNGQDPDLGFIEGGVKFVQDVAEGINLAVAVNGAYDMFDGAKDVKDPLSGAVLIAGAPYVPFWQAGVGVSVMYQKMASLGIGWRGESWKWDDDVFDKLDTELGSMQVDLWAMPIADQPLELYAVLGLGLGDSDIYDSMFDSFEVSVKYTVGKAYFYVGYLYNAEEGFFIAKEAADLDVYGKADIGNYLSFDDGASAIVLRLGVSL
jgi:hypothetical protein